MQVLIWEGARWMQEAPEMAVAAETRKGLRKRCENQRALWWPVAKEKSTEEPQLVSGETLTLVCLSC